MADIIPGTGASSLADPERLRRRCAMFEERLDRIMEINSGIIYVLDAQGKFTFLNRAVKEILHYEPEELIGKHFSVIMSTEEYERVGRDHVLPKFIGKATGLDNAPKLFDERRSRERRTKSIEVQLLTKEKKDVRILKGDVSGIMGSEGFYGPGQVESPVSFLGSQGIIFDITGYKEIERQRKELERKCFEVQKYNAVGRLAGGAAHHFNNKLGTILGYAELTRHKGDSLPPEILRYLEQIVSAAKQCADLTAQLLTFAREGNLSRGGVNVNDLMRDVSQFITTTVRRNIHSRLSLDLRNPVLEGDASEIRSAILDVAMNGCDAMPDGGELVFETGVVDAAALPPECVVPGPRVAHYVRCSIMDSGIGMSDDVKSRIFEPFFTTKEVGEGIGLGLSYVYGCVTGHGGFIDMQSEPGKGTRFHLYFPCATESGRADGGDGGAAQPVRGKGRIVVADDDGDIRKVMKDILEDLGYTVAVFGDGLEAVEYFKGHAEETELVIFDINMQRMDGANCYRRLKEIRPDVSVVVTTGHIVSDDIEILLKDGVKDFLPKPFNINHFSRVVAKVIRSEKTLDRPG